MIKEMSGDLLRAPADVLVNTVNTHGVMGKGIALQFKRAYPAMYDEYRRAAKAGELRLGQVTVWPTGQLAGPKYIVNFPTKGHWKSKSRIDDIRAGLEDLVSVVRVRGITSIAVPPLGCGNGGLAWEAVLPLIEEAFAALPEVEVQVFPPQSCTQSR